MRRRILNTKVIPVGWHVITVPSIAANEIRTNIEFKIPRYFRECWGIMFSANKDNSSLDGTFDFDGDAIIDPSRACILGTITLHLNSKRSNPVQLPVRVKPLTQQRRKFLPYRLQETLKANTLVQAEYKDTSLITTLYDLKIYLVGERDNSIRH